MRREGDGREGVHGVDRMNMREGGKRADLLRVGNRCSSYLRGCIGAAAGDGRAPVWRRGAEGGRPWLWRATAQANHRVSNHSMAYPRYWRKEGRAGHVEKYVCKWWMCSGVRGHWPCWWIAVEKLQ